MSTIESRAAVLELVEAIDPMDTIEARDQTSAIAWIKSRAEIFRIQKPDIPPKHLVAYFVVLDRIAMKIVLVDHIKAQLWLPAGGHVEMNEHPTDTVRREIREELGIEADFVFDAPLFLTETVTVGLTAGHRDISLWYVVAGNTQQPLHFDRHEFKAYHWFSFEEILALPINILDPHMHRFVKKLQQKIK